MNEVTRMAHDVLVECRRVLSDPARWHKGDMMVMYGNGHTAFCSLGVVHQMTHEKEAANAEVFALLDHTMKACLHGRWQGQIAAFNDAGHTTHAEVLAYFDRCIAYVKEQMEPVLAESIDPIWSAPGPLDPIWSVPVSSFTFANEKPVSEVTVEKGGIVFVPQTFTFTEMIETPEPVKELVPA